jgi:hypothetical protein
LDRSRRAQIWYNKCQPRPHLSPPPRIQWPGQTLHHNRSYQDQWREGLLLPWYRIPWHRNEAAASELPTGEVAIGARSRAEKWFARMGRKDLPLGCRAEARPQHDAARPIDRTTGGPSFEECRARRDPQSTMKPPIAQSMPKMKHPNGGNPIPHDAHPACLARRWTTQGGRTHCLYGLRGSQVARLYSLQRNPRERCGAKMAIESAIPRFCERQSPCSTRV